MPVSQVTYYKYSIHVYLQVTCTTFHAASGLAAKSIHSVMSQSVVQLSACPCRTEGFQCCKAQLHVCTQLIQHSNRQCYLGGPLKLTVIPYNSQVQLLVHVRIRPHTFTHRSQAINDNSHTYLHSIIHVCVLTLISTQSSTHI